MSAIPISTSTAPTSAACSVTPASAAMAAPARGGGMEHNLLQNALVYLAAAVLVVPVAKRLGLGTVLGFLLAGILIGPYGFKLISAVEDAYHFAEFGVVLLLFLTAWSSTRTGCGRCAGRSSAGAGPRWRA